MKYLEAQKIIERTKNKVIFITESINLQNQEIRVGLGNVLIFQGGEFINGTVSGQNTVVLGNVKISRMAGTWYNIGTTLPNTELYNGRTYYNSSIGKFVVYDGSKWVESDGATVGVLRAGTFSNKPAASDIYIGFKYFCTDKQTTEGATDGIEIIHKGNDVWVDALGRVVS